MKNSIYLIFSLLVFISCQAENTAKNNKSSEKTVSELATEAAKAAIQKGELKLLKATANQKSKYDLNEVLDSLMQLMDGLHYQYGTYKGIDSIKVYRKAFNKEMKVHLNQKFGPNWSQCLAVKNIMERQEQLFKLYTVEELVGQFVILPGSIFFDPTTNQMDSTGIKLVEMNLIGLLETDKLGAQTLQVYIRAFYDKNSSADAALKRSIALQKELEKGGFPPSRILIQEHQQAVLPDCSQCPFSIAKYANRVELSFND
jgi:hypothetical protein